MLPAYGRTPSAHTAAWIARRTEQHHRMGGATIGSAAMKLPEAHRGQMTRADRPASGVRDGGTQRMDSRTGPPLGSLHEIAHRISIGGKGPRAIRLCRRQDQTACRPAAQPAFPDRQHRSGQRIAGAIASPSGGHGRAAGDGECWSLTQARIQEGQAQATVMRHFHNAPGAPDPAAPIAPTAAPPGAATETSAAQICTVWSKAFPGQHARASPPSDPQFADDGTKIDQRPRDGQILSESDTA